MRLLIALSICISLFSVAAPAQVVAPIPQAQTVLRSVWANPNHGIPSTARPDVTYDSTYQPSTETPHIGPFTAHPYTELKLGPGGEYRVHSGIRVGYDIDSHQSIELRDKGLGWTFKF